MTGFEFKIHSKSNEVNKIAIEYEKKHGIHY